MSYIEMTGFNKFQRMHLQYIFKTNMAYLSTIILMLLVESTSSKLILNKKYLSLMFGKFERVAINYA